MHSIYAKSLKPKAKRLVYFSIFIIMLLAFSIKHSANTYGQTPFEKTKEEYSIQLKKYNLARNNYLTKKANYEAFKTATAKKETFESTKSYLIEINFLLADKLRLVKEYGNSIDWENSNYNKNELLTLLDEELSYLQNHWADVDKTTALEQLPPLAQELKDRLNTTIVAKTDKNIGAYELVSTERAHANSNSLTQQIKSYINPLSNDNNRAIINNWDSEIDSVNQNIQLDIDKAKLEFEKISIERKSSRVNNVIEATKGARAELEKSLDLYREILRII